MVTLPCLYLQQSLNDAYDQLQAAGAVVVAVGSELPFSMAAFKSKLSLRYPILSDVNLKVSIAMCSVNCHKPGSTACQGVPIFFDNTMALLILHMEPLNSSTCLWFCCTKSF
jgi:peroxiredoxin